MKNIMLSGICLLFAATAFAQTTNKAITEHDPAVRAKDSLIKVTLIDPARKAALPGDPDWEAITKTITAKYDATTADRTVTKAKIYFYYSKDWPQFCAGIVHYTNNYEMADDDQLLNLNAGMIASQSNDQAQLKEALRWAKLALDKEPDNEKYKATYNALTAKITQ